MSVISSLGDQSFESTAAATTTMGNDISSISLTRFRLTPVDQNEPSSDGLFVSGSPADVSDEMLLNCVAAGETDKLALIFRRYARTVHSVGSRILHDPGEADDLVQEVFLYIHRRCALYDRSKGSARSWIFQVAYTQAFLRRRHLKSHGFYASGIADKTRESEPLTKSVADYDQTAEGMFGRTVWRNTLESLSSEQRETLRLHFFEGYTFREIAEKQGQSYANVRNHYYRGLEKLRQRLCENAVNRR
jgi:RNA polymerase sigma-70 factor, ECF subfamily